MKKNNSADNSKNTAPDRVQFAKEALKSGEVLSALVLRFLNNRNKENMLSLLSCLRDSSVWIPARIKTADGTDPQIPKLADSTAIFPAKQSLIIKPQIYKASDGTLYMPIYSRRENMKKEYIQDFAAVNVPYFKCLQMLDGMQNCNRLVLDPHLYNVPIDESLIDITKKLPSRLPKERKKNTTSSKSKK